MRCPYCGGTNSDRATYCTYCGRDLVSGQPASRPQPRQGPSTQTYPPPARPSQAPHPAPGRPASAPVPQPPPAQSVPRSSPPLQVPVSPPPAPEPPAPFPPHAIEQLRALEQGALAYNVVDTSATYGRKKIVNIIYPRCAAWQQVATLLKAFKDQQETNVDTIVIQGYWQQDDDALATNTFTNGHLIFDRNVRLGSQIMNRYQIETGNGFDSDSVRIVLSE